MREEILQVHPTRRLFYHQIIPFNFHSSTGIYDVNSKKSSNIYNEDYEMVLSIFIEIKTGLGGDALFSALVGTLGYQTFTREISLVLTWTKVCK